MSSNRGPYTHQISGEEGELASASPLSAPRVPGSVRSLTQKNRAGGVDALLDGRRAQSIQFETAAASRLWERLL